jgi:hypothetical protein
MLKDGRCITDRHDKTAQSVEMVGCAGFLSPFKRNSIDPHLEGRHTIPIVLKKNIGFTPQPFNWQWVMGGHSGMDQKRMGTHGFNTAQGFLDRNFIALAFHIRQNKHRVILGAINN